MLSLLQQRDAGRMAARWKEWRLMRETLKISLGRHLPGQQVWLFGSITQPGRFNAASDIDLAIEALPGEMSLYTLTAQIETDVRRPVDVVYLPESRLRDKIIASGESWTA